MDNRFGVATSPELVAFSGQLRSELLVVVNLAVEDDPHGAILVGDWLVTPDEVNDGQAPHAQADVSLEIEAVAVRAAVDHCPVHMLVQFRAHGLLRVGVYLTAYATHQRCTLVEMTGVVDMAISRLG